MGYIPFQPPLEDRIRDLEALVKSQQTIIAGLCQTLKVSPAQYCQPPQKPQRFQALRKLGKTTKDFLIRHLKGKGIKYLATIGLLYFLTAIGVMATIAPFIAPIIAPIIEAIRKMIGL